MLPLCTMATQTALPSCQQVPLTPLPLDAIEFRNLLNSDCYLAILLCTAYCNAYSQLGVEVSGLQVERLLAVSMLGVHGSPDG